MSNVLSMFWWLLSWVLNFFFEIVLCNTCISLALTLEPIILYKILEVCKWAFAIQQDYMQKGRHHNYGTFFAWILFSKVSEWFLICYVSKSFWKEWVKGCINTTIWWTLLIFHYPWSIHMDGSFILFLFLWIVTEANKANMLGILYLTIKRDGKSKTAQKDFCNVSVLKKHAWSFASCCHMQISRWWWCCCLRVANA